MHVLLGVENFAKIESAKVCIDSYTLLVGPNNSGKTFFMQLIQGINEKLVNLIDDDILRTFIQDRNLCSDNINNPDIKYKKYIISQKNLLLLIEYLNQKLETRKEQILKEIFGKEVPIGKLYIEIIFEKNEYYEITISNEVKSLRKAIPSFTKSFLEDISDLFEGSKIGVLTEHDSAKGQEKIMFFSTSRENDELYLIRNSIKRLLKHDSIFLPASRTGLMLLYREFFANRVDRMVSYELNADSFLENKSAGHNLTQPVYQFLRFLQTYTEDEDFKRHYKNEIDFFEKRLIEGHISTSRHSGFFYDSQSDHVSVPMYIASSMVNEIAPVELILTDSRRYNRLIIDEVEASLHPKKQLEFVKFLNRLSNKGMKLILSTHSDTFASKVNSLYILSEYIAQNKDNDRIKKMGLENEDLIDPRKVFVYEFINQPAGKSIVKEIIGDPTTGFQFDLFTDSALHLYNEALKIGEILQNDKP